MDLSDGPPPAPESAAAAAAAPPGTPSHVPEGGNDGANEALSAADLAAVSRPSRPPKRRLCGERERLQRTRVRRKQIARRRCSTRNRCCVRAGRCTTWQVTAPPRKENRSWKPALRVGAFVRAGAGGDGPRHPWAGAVRGQRIRRRSNGLRRHGVGDHQIHARLGAAAGSWYRDRPSHQT